MPRPFHPCEPERILLRTQDARGGLSEAESLPVLTSGGIYHDDRP